MSQSESQDSKVPQERITIRNERRHSYNLVVFYQDEQPFGSFTIYTDNVDFLVDLEVLKEKLNARLKSRAKENHRGNVY